MSIDLRGTFLPVTTPFDPVTGDVDVVALRANVRHWMQHPLSGILVAGSTGESVYLDDGETASMLEATRAGMQNMQEDMSHLYGGGQ